MCNMLQTLVLALVSTTANCVVTITRITYLMLKIARSVGRPCWLSMQGRGEYKCQGEAHSLCSSVRRRWRGTELGTLTVKSNSLNVTHCSSRGTRFEFLSRCYAGWKRHKATPRILTTNCSVIPYVTLHIEAVTNCAGDKRFGLDSIGQRGSSLARFLGPGASNHSCCP
jgi:hypothetical protein